MAFSRNSYFNQNFLKILTYFEKIYGLIKNLTE